MSSSTLADRHVQFDQAQTTAALSSGFILRAALLLGCLAAVTLAAWVGNPAAHLQSDLELAQLLRGMAIIKAGIVIAAAGLLLWRFRRPVPVLLAWVYLLGGWLIAGASMMIWQLTLIPLAALAFHVGELAMLVAAWRDWDRPSRVPRDQTAT